MRIIELIDEIPDVHKKAKICLMMDVLVELGGLLHQQNNVVGNTNAVIAGDEVRAARCAVETKEIIEEIKSKILQQL